MTPLLKVSGLRVRYGELDAVRQLDLEVAQGETVALAGESGCGKSTSALAIMGLLPAEARIEGEVLFEGQDLLRLAPKPARALRGGSISMIFQDSMSVLNPVVTVGAQISEALRIHAGLSGRALRDRSIELLDLVEIPEPQRRAGDYPHQFSGGQRQRVAIAMAVACQPKLLIADEPTTALDVAIQEKILELLDRLRRELGMGLLLITHDLGLVGRWADRVAVMLRGLKVEDARTASVLARPSHPYTKVLLGAALGIDDRHYRTTRLAEVASDPINLDAARSFGAASPNPPAAVNRPASAPLLSLVDVRTHYAGRDGPVAAVDGVSFDIAPGETVGLVGEFGCGKSTLCRTILQLTPASGGRIIFEGNDLADLDGRGLKAARQRMQMVFQDPQASLNPRRSVGAMLDATLRVNGVGDRRERRTRIAEIIDRVRLPQGALSRYPHEFSGGQRQRIAIARALILRPALLICDEPASSLDLPIRAQILNLLVDLKTDFGLSYLFISHDLSVVRYMADRVLVMQAGKIVEQGDHREIWASPKHPYTRSLLEAAPRAQGRAPSRRDEAIHLAAQ